jgi:endonuclease G
LVPLASLSASPDAAALNYLSNCTPQRSALNQQIWNRLESAARRLALSDGVQSVYGMTGPLYERPMPPLPGADEAHRVPSGYFKILALTSEGSVETAAFVMDQKTAGSDRFCDHQVTVREIERRAGLDFFVGLPDPQEAALEGRIGTLARRLGCE